MEREQSPGGCRSPPAAGGPGHQLPTQPLVLGGAKGLWVEGGGWATVLCYSASGTSRRGLDHPRSSLFMSINGRHRRR